MKKSFLSFIFLSFLMVIQLEGLLHTCNCLSDSNRKHIDSIYKKRHSFSITAGDPSSPSHPYSVIASALIAQQTRSPIFYFQYHNNLLIFNELLVNGMNFRNNNIILARGKRDCDFNRQEILENQEAIVRYRKGIDINYDIDEELRDAFRQHYYYCQHWYKHNNPAILYDYAFLEYSEGNASQAADLTESYINACKVHEIDYQAESEELLLLGQSYIELAQFSKAIEMLSEAIQKDPGNKEAYFHRSAAYFETGNFELALQDFTLSNKGASFSKVPYPISDEFSNALLSSLCEAASEAAVDFVPSLCSSTYGLAEALWANAQHPEQSRQNFTIACYEMSQCVVDYCKNIDWNTAEDYVEQIKALYDHYEKLSESEKGQYIGSVIGKYGVEIFAGGLAIKGVKVCSKGINAYRNLRNANRVCNLEGMALSSTNKTTITSSALQHASQRDTYLKNVRINWAKQNKHIPGKHNFIPGGGKIALESSEFEVLVKERVGSGQRVVGEFGTHGYKERIDFGKIIGEYALQIEGKPTQYIPTTKGIVVYARDGSVHVIPSAP